MLYPLKFRPVYKQYAWGGKGLEMYGRVLPGDKVATSWEVACHDNGMSVVTNGQYEGKTLGWLMEQFGRKLMGDGLDEKHLKKFPLIMKFVDANEDLPIQVHPDDNYAFIHENGQSGKHETWYVIKAKPGAKLIVGFKTGIDRSTLENALSHDGIMEWVNVVEVHEGDSFDIPAGLLHALGSGIIIAEVQQNSDITYTIYEHIRENSGMKPEVLQIEKALDVIDYRAAGRYSNEGILTKELPGVGTAKLLVANDYYAVEVLDIDGEINETPAKSTFSIYTFVDGDGIITYEQGTEHGMPGDSVMIPAYMGAYRISGKFTALRTTVENPADVIKRFGK